MFRTPFLHDLRIWIEWHGSALTALGTAAMAVALAGGVLFACVYAYQVRRAAYTRRILGLLHQYQSPSLSAARAAWARKQLAGQPAAEELQLLLDFFGSVGFALRRGFVRAEDVWETLGSAVLSFSAGAREQIAQLQRSNPEPVANFSFLIDTLHQMQKKHAEKNVASPGELNTSLQQRRTGRQTT